MVSPGLPSTRSGADVNAEDDWPRQVAEQIESLVQTVRERTTKPALTIARGIVFGTFAAIVAVAALVLLIVASVRLLDSYLPSAVFGDDHTWAAHMIMGLVFCALGAFLWVKRR
jgi:hypothetical protein